jgi:DNA anti-recombination protein RmuC
VVAEGFRSVLRAADAYEASLCENTGRLATLVDDLRRDVPAVRDNIVSLIKAVSDSTVHSEEEVARIGAEISDRFNDAAVAIRDEMSASLASANREVNENISKLVGATKEQTEALEIGLEESIRKSLETFGQQMASLSSRFVDDYAPLTERLRALVGVGSVAS